MGLESPARQRFCRRCGQASTASWTGVRSLALTGTRVGWDQSLVDPADNTRANKSCASYDWYRRAVAECAVRVGKSPVDVDRALWQVSREARGITWARYAKLLEQDLARWVRD